jgi:galactitol-specific phosphotransferase system IIC component
MIGGEIGSEIGTFLGLVSGGLVGAAAGKVIGKVLGTVITTAACSGIILVSSAVKDIRETAKHLDDYRKKEREIFLPRLSWMLMIVLKG